MKKVFLDMWGNAVIIQNASSLISEIKYVASLPVSSFTNWKLSNFDKHLRNWVYLLYRGCTQVTRFQVCNDRQSYDVKQEQTFLIIHIAAYLSLNSETKQEVCVLQESKIKQNHSVWHLQFVSNKSISWHCLLQSNEFT